MKRLIDYLTGKSLVRSVKVTFGKDELHNFLIEYQVIIRSEGGYEIYHGNISEVKQWLSDHSFNYVPGTDGIWSSPVA